MHLVGYGRYMSGASAVVLTEDGGLILAVPAWEVPCAEADASADRVVGYGDSDRLDFAPARAIARRCNDYVRGRVGLASDDPAVHKLFSEVLGQTMIDVTQLAYQIRRVKDSDELIKLRRARALSLVAQNRIGQLATPGVTEIELFTAGHGAAQLSAGAPLDFLASVAAGSRSAAVGMAPPSAVPGPATVASGDVVLCDVAVRHGGYWGDTTRTLILGENSEAVAVRDEVSAVLLKAANVLRPGVPVCEVYEAIQRELRSGFPTARSPAHGGHALGVTVDESPQIIPSEQMRLEAGMVLAVEPAVYFEGRFGVRVEDVFLVTPGGGICLGDLTDD
jgi:Xaa-Pro aminopeptidase